MSGGTVDLVQVWLVDLNLSAPILAELDRLLDDDDRRRASGLRSVDRRRFTASHGAFRTIVGGCLGAPPDELRWRRGRHGKPSLTGPWTGLEVNLSHSGDLAAVAVTRRRAIGVDIQRSMDRLDPVRFAARFFNDAEARFVAGADRAPARADRLLRLWVRKEACVKAAGARLAQCLAVPVWPDGEEGFVGDTVLVRDPARRLPGDYLVRDVPVRPGFHAAVALAGARHYRIASHVWPG